MRIIAKSTLRRFWERHPDAKDALDAWHEQTKREEWASPADVRERYPRASIVGSDRVVFRIKGNRYRMVVRVLYPKGIVYIRFIGTHGEYNRIAAEEV